MCTRRCFFKLRLILLSNRCNVSALDVTCNFQCNSFTAANMLAYTWSFCLPSRHCLANAISSKNSSPLSRVMYGIEKCVESNHTQQKTLLGFVHLCASSKLVQLHRQAHLHQRLAHLHHSRLDHNQILPNVTQALLTCL